MKRGGPRRPATKNQELRPMSIRNSPVFRFTDASAVVSGAICFPRQRRPEGKGHQGPGHRFRNLIQPARYPPVCTPARGRYGVTSLAPPFPSAFPSLSLSLSLFVLRQRALLRLSLSFSPMTNPFGFACSPTLSTGFVSPNASPSVLPRYPREHPVLVNSRVPIYGGYRLIF